MKQAWICMLLLCLPAGLWGQSKNPVTDVVREMLPRQQKNLVAAVEEMPADKFSYQPTKEQMTFAHLVGHIVESNNFLCAKAGDVAPPKVQPVKDTDGKDKLVAALKASFDYCTSALAKGDDAKLGDPIELWGGRKATRAFAWVALASDWADHYGAAAMYLRLNGMLPPTAQKK